MMQIYWTRALQTKVSKASWKRLIRIFRLRRGYLKLGKRRTILILKLKVLLQPQLRNEDEILTKNQTRTICNLSGDSISLVDKYVIKPK